MKLKKLILSVLGLLIFVAASYAGKNPARPDFRPVLKSHKNSGASWCDFSGSPADKPVRGWIDPDLEFLPPAKYLTRIGIYEVLDEAISKNDKIAAEVVVFCMGTPRNIGAVMTTNGVPFHLVLAYYGNSKIATDMAKFFMDKKSVVSDPTPVSDLDYSDRTPITLASEYGGKEIIKMMLSRTDDYKPNPYAKVTDYLEDPNGKMKDSFDLAANDEILKILRTIKPTAALIEDAARKTMNYAMTNEKWILKAMREIADNSISRDVFRLFDINGYKTDITRI